MSLVNYKKYGEKILGKKVHFNATGSVNVERVWQYIQKQQAAEEVKL
jgi:hypothetical protein